MPSFRFDAPFAGIRASCAVRYPTTFQPASAILVSAGGFNVPGAAAYMSSAYIASNPNGTAVDIALLPEKHGRQSACSVTSPRSQFEHRTGVIMVENMPIPQSERFAPSYSFASTLCSISAAGLRYGLSLAAWR